MSIGGKAQTQLQASIFGVMADGVTDDTAALQEAIDYAIRNNIYRLQLPNGQIKVTDTIHIGYGNDVYSSLSVVSEHERPSYFVFGSRIKATFSDRPIINVQGGRHVCIKGIGISGSLATTSINAGLPANQSVWDAICPTHPKKQFAAISIDAYSGPEPTSAHYENAPKGWSKWYSSDVRIRDCFISNVGCGVVTKPSGGDANGDYVQCDDSYFDSCKYALSVNGSQTRGNRLNNCKIVNCFAAIGIGWYGPNLGQASYIDKCAVEGCTWWIKGTNTDWVPTLSIRDSFGERCNGIVDLTNGGGNCMVSITSNSFDIYGGNDSTSEVRQHINVPGCGLRFEDNRIFNQGTTRPTFVIRSGVQHSIQNNIVRRFLPTNGGPLLAVIPASGSQTNAIIKNNAATGTDVIATTPTSGTLMTSAIYEGNRSFRGVSASGVILHGNVGEIIAHANYIDGHATLFKLISKAGPFDPVRIEQVTDCTATEPIDIAGTLARIQSSRMGWRLIP